MEVWFQFQDLYISTTDKALNSHPHGFCLMCFETLSNLTYTKENIYQNSRIVRILKTNLKVYRVVFVLSLSLICWYLPFLDAFIRLSFVTEQFIRTASCWMRGLGYPDNCFNHSVYKYSPVIEYWRGTLPILSHH